MSRLPYVTPEKNTFKYYQQRNAKKSLTPPTVEPKLSTYSTIHRSKRYGDEGANINLDYQRIIYDDIPSARYSRQEKLLYDNGDRYAINLPSPSSRYHNRQSKYFQMSEQQLRQIIYNYELQIASLKDYIHESEYLERRRIIDIFGFSYANYMHQNGEPCDCHFQSEQSKKMIKELSNRVSHLLRQNERLNSQQKQSLRSVRVERIKTEVDDQRLLRENERLRKILEEYENNEQESSQKLRSQIYGLNNHIRELEEQNRQLIVSNRKSEIKVVQKVVEKNTSKEQIEFAKTQITKNVYQFSQELQSRNKGLLERINQQQNRIQHLEKQVAAYKKQRQLQIQSTIRKSYILSQSIKRPSGDQDQQVYNRDEQMSKDVFQSYSKSKVGNPMVNIQKFEQEKNELNNKIQMLQMRIRNLQQNLRGRELRIQQLENSLNQKVSHIILLEKQLQNARNSSDGGNKEVVKDLEREIQKLRKQNAELITRSSEYHIKYIEKQIYDPQIQSQIKQIRSILLECNPNNFDLFFQQFNQIIEQRNLMNSKIAEYQSVSSHLLQSKRTKANNDSLNNKIVELNQENRRLMNRIAQLQDEVERYHSEIIQSEIKKLTEIDFGGNPELSPSGKEAMNWQRVVKSCIQNTVVRLQAIQNKMSKKEPSKIIRKQGIITHERPKSSITEIKNTQSKLKLISQSLAK